MTECTPVRIRRNDYQCTRCGHIFPGITVLPIRRVCRHERRDLKTIRREHYLERAAAPVLLGDLIHAVAVRCRIDRLATWLAQKQGREGCNCPERRARLNEWHRQRAKGLARRLARLRWSWSTLRGRVVRLLRLSQQLVQVNRPHDKDGL